MLASLAATQPARRPTQLERRVLRTVVPITTGHRHHNAPATLRDVVGLLEAPTEELCVAVQRSEDGFIRDLQELRFAIDELGSGTFAGMFDGPTTVDVDWSGRHRRPFRCRR
jgi:hypothetical protein